MFSSLSFQFDHVNWSGCIKHRTHLTVSLRNVVPYDISLSFHLVACILIFSSLNDCFRVAKEQRMKTTSNPSEEDLKPIRLLDVVLSWPLEDVLNENLYKDKVLGILFLMMLLLHVLTSTKF